MIRWAKYLVERWMLRGSWALVLVLVVLLALIAVSGGVVAYWLPGHHFSSLESAIWWAVLRISDPGYLSDDIPSIGVRALSVVLSVLGMSVTVGGIVAIVVQAMNMWLSQLGSATTPVPFRDHIVVIGWTDRTPHLLRKICSRYDGRIVVLLENVEATDVRRLARALSRKDDVERVTLRRGNPFRKQELDRAACRWARCIIIPASAEAVAGSPDAAARSLKILLSIRAVVGTRRPPVVVELVDRAIAPLAEETYSPIRLLESDRVLARSMRLGLQASDVLHISEDLVTTAGSYRLYAVPPGEHVGQTIQEAEQGLPGGKHLIGALRRKPNQRLFMKGGDVVRKDDLLAYLNSPDYALCGSREVPDEIIETLLEEPLRNILVLGWGELVPDLLDELSLEGTGHYRLDVLASANRQVVEHALDDFPLVETRFVSALPTSLGKDELDDLGRYDSVLVLADRSLSPESADVNTMAVLLAIQRRRREFRANLSVVAEFLDEEDLELVGNPDVLVSPHLAAEVLASLALTPESQEELEGTLELQRTYTSHIVELPSGDEWDCHNLQEKLRRRGVALLHVFASQKGEKKRALIARPVASSRAKKDA